MAKNKKKAKQPQATNSGDNKAQENGKKKNPPNQPSAKEKSQKSAPAEPQRTKTTPRTSQSSNNKNKQQSSGKQGSSWVFWLVVVLIGAGVAASGVVFRAEIQEVAEKVFHEHVHPQYLVLREMIDKALEGDQGSSSSDTPQGSGTQQKRDAEEERERETLKEEAREMKKREEEARLKKEKEEKEARERQRKDEEAREKKKKEEEEARLKKEREEKEARERKKKEEEEAKERRKKEEEARQRKKKEEEEAKERQKREEEARERKKKEEEEARAKKEKEEREARERQKKEEEARVQKEKEEKELKERQKKEEEAKERQKKEEEARAQKEKEEKELKERQKKEEEAKEKKKKEEEEAKERQRKEQEAAERKKREEEERQKKEEETKKRQKKEEEEAKEKQKKEEEAAKERQKKEEEAREKQKKEEEAAKERQKKEEEAAKERQKKEEEARERQRKEAEERDRQKKEEEEARARKEKEEREAREKQKKEEAAAKSQQKTPAEPQKDSQTKEKPSESKQEKVVDRSSYAKASITNDEDFKIRVELDEADDLLEKEQIDEAIKKYDAILVKSRMSARGHYGKGVTLDKLGFKYRSNEYLESAIDFLGKVLDLPDVPEELMKLAGRKLAERQQFRGWGSKAVKTFKTLTEKFPLDLALQNELGVSYMMIGQNDRARDVFKEVLHKHPDSGFAKAHLGFIFKTQDNDHDLGAHLLKQGIESGEPGTSDGRFYLHLGDALLRLGKEEEARKYYKEGEVKGLFMSAWQRSLYNVDGLTARPWWTPKQTGYESFLKLLKDNWETIRDEGLAQLNSKTGSFVPEEENLRDTGDWKQFTLYQQGRKKKDNCAKAPKTCALIDQIPDAKSCKRGQVKFSVMSPGIHVWPHVGPTNCRLRAHLGLVVPEGPVIRVVNETRQWKEGDFIIFDDSFEHEVWHKGSELRLVLIVDFWHPELTEEQKRTLSAI